MIVVWRVTSRCNLSCAFCRYDRTLGGPRSEAELTDVFKFAAVLSAYQQQTDDPVLVSWIGGEPLRWRHVKEATRRLTGEWGLRVSATTNGTTLETEAERAFAGDHFAELTVSLDAAGPMHDAFRGWSGGFETLRRVVPELVQRKRELGRGPLLRINTVLMRDNVAGFEELCRCVAAWGVDEITFNQLGGLDRPEFFPAHRLRPDDVEQLADLLPRLRAWLGGQGVKLTGGDGYLSRMRASVSGVTMPVRDCRPGERFLFVDEYGRVAPCNYTSGLIGVPLNEVEDVDALRALPARLRSTRERCRPTACEDCHSTQVWEKFAR